jgi:hypothetical protein
MRQCCVVIFASALQIEAQISVVKKSTKSRYLRRLLEPLPLCKLSSISKVAPSDSTVLIAGETRKELLHAPSTYGHFVPRTSSLDCAAPPVT